MKEGRRKKEEGKCEAFVACGLAGTKPDKSFSNFSFFFTFSSICPCNLIFLYIYQFDFLKQGVTGMGLGGTRRWGRGPRLGSGFQNGDAVRCFCLCFHRVLPDGQ